MQSKHRAGRITTHVLDTASGLPAAGMALELRRDEGAGAWRSLGHFRTKADGRCDTPLLEGEALSAGLYEILFEVAGLGNGGFYETIPVRFRVTDPQADHHVPLILAPFGYTTYRGS